ncbi:N-acetylmuramoyl-L-alanine amidase [Akkermansia massiliensis]
MKVCIDIGHCPSDHGAENRNYNSSEYRFWKTFAPRTARYLQDLGHDPVIVNRETDGGGTGMTACVRACNEANADVIVALHANAYNDKASGTETLYWHSSPRGKRLAQCIQARMVKALNLPDRGIKPITGTDRGGKQLRKTVAPCVIVEPFFLDNDHDYETALEHAANLCRAIAVGIANY